jgi:hypothetical protein
MPMKRPDDDEPAGLCHALSRGAENRLDNGRFQ